MLERKLSPLSLKKQNIFARPTVLEAVFILRLEDCYFVHGILFLVRNVRIGLAITVKASRCWVLYVFG
ncbi:hypothetical protein [Acetobacter oryzoeni]|uniref:Uncharacterized protein n=1 Tax=Acetobacter oryzoeni TaxID=2500548 RepID=A0A5B9GGU5_9PROT|nr:hypothetical protein [Acetobacter oryzoeni]MCP1203543.1 hypothetical protein [Acetobacter oryzoeni]QEE85451.1 hypothetical protein EOV40_006765 [Acetobacter oryzoeni]